MKNLSNSLMRRMYVLCSALVLSFTFSSQAQIETLLNNNSAVVVDAGSQAGANFWSLDGNGLSGVNQLAQQQFWYRIGPTGGESSINTIGSPTVTQSDARHLDMLYQNGSLSVEVGYVLSGGVVGSGTSGMNETYTIRNLSGAALDLHFFQYSDFTLGGSSSGQTSAFSQSGGRYNKVQQTGTGTSLSTTFTGLSGVSIISPSVEAALYNTTLGELNDASPTTLSGVATSPVGNATYGVEWDVVLAASGSGSSLQITELTSLQVPEPSAISLLLTGVIGAGWLGRKRRK